MAAKGKSKYEVQLKDLPGIYPEVFSICGEFLKEREAMELTLRLAEEFGGGYFYFSKLDEITRAARDRQIRREFNGANHRELAKKFRMSDRWLRNVLMKSEGGGKNG